MLAQPPNPGAAQVGLPEDSNKDSLHTPPCRDILLGDIEVLVELYVGQKTCPSHPTMKGLKIYLGITGI